MRSKLLKLLYYPIKSLKGIEVEQAILDSDGLANDRKWMLIDENGKAITQRDIPELTLVKTQMLKGQLYVGYKDSIISLPTASSFDINDPMDDFTAITKATIFSEEAIVVEQMSQVVSEWFSDHFSQNIRLVRNLDSFPRRKHIKEYNTEVPLKFTDGYPVHVISDASLRFVEEAMEGKHYLRRFRPNILVEAEEAFDEDKWVEIAGEDFLLNIVKKTGRCAVPGVNPSTGEKGTDVLKWLAENRKFDNNTCFGVYCIVQKPGKASKHEDLSIN